MFAVFGALIFSAVERENEEYLCKMAKSEFKDFLDSLDPYENDTYIGTGRIFLTNSLLQLVTYKSSIRLSLWTMSYEKFYMKLILNKQIVFTTSNQLFTL